MARPKKGQSEERNEKIKNKCFCSAIYAQDINAFLLQKRLNDFSGHVLK